LKSKIFTKITGAVIVFSVICALAYFVALPAAADSDVGPWYSIIPPVLAIMLAFITRRVLFSLGTAIIIGGLLTQATRFTTDAFALFKGLKTTTTCVTSSIADIENLWILSFVVLIFIMLKILVVSGGFNGLIKLTVKFIKGKKSTQLLTAFLGVGFFIDDYANAIIVGSAMRPLTDRFRISREKLAFIVDATSAPVTGLAVISTWIATEVSLFENVMLIFVFLNILIKVDFGPMKTAEKKANSGDISEESSTDSTGGKIGKESSLETQRMGKPASAIFPIVGLLLFHLTALWIAGGGLEKISNGYSPASLSYWRQTISDVKSSSQILTLSSSFGILLAVTSAVFIEKLKFKTIAKAALTSVKTSYIPFSVLILAWSLKNCCDQLGTGQFLISILADNISPLIFPALVFFVASITSFATGTSWGTMAILIPTAIPVAFALDGNSYGVTTMISLGAVLDGAIFGDHCSPISDTTILSSIASRCDLIQHVRTQLPYSLFVAALAFLCGYLPAAAFGLRWIWTVGIATLIMAGFLAVLARRVKKLPNK